MSDRLTVCPRCETPNLVSVRNLDRVYPNHDVDVEQLQESTVCVCVRCGAENPCEHGDTVIGHPASGDTRGGRGGGRGE